MSPSRGKRDQTPPKNGETFIYISELCVGCGSRRKRTRLSVVTPNLQGNFAFLGPLITLIVAKNGLVSASYRIFPVFLPANYKGILNRYLGQLAFDQGTLPPYQAAKGPDIA